MPTGLESTTKEKLRVHLISRADPTGSAVEFSVTAIDAADPGTYSAGSWEGTWNTTTGRVVALTPTIGATGTLVIAGATSYKLWIRWSFGSETIVQMADTLIAS